MDDKMWRNRKFRQLRQTRQGLAAIGVWSLYWSWCLDDPALDGLVPRSELSRLELPLAEMLVGVGLWDREPDGFRFHDFHEYNPTAQQVGAKREADRTRIADKRADPLPPVARMSHATFPRVASTRDPSPIPSPRSHTQERESARAPACDPLELEGDHERPLSHSDLWDSLETAERPAGEPDGTEEARDDPEPPETSSLLAGKHTEALRAAEERRRASAHAAWAENLPKGFQLGGAANGNAELVDDRDGMIRGSPEDDQEEDKQRPEQITRRFQALWEHAYGSLPYLGGKNVWDFPQRVRATARLRKVDALKLLGETFEQFVREKRTDEQEQRMQSAPYAFFAARFGALVAKPASQTQTGPALLKKRIGEALTKGDRKQYEALNVEYNRLYLGGRDAKPASN